MEEMQIFMNEKFGQIRTKEINGEPWFCLADVCKPLGIRAKDCKLRLKQGGVDTIALPTKSGTQNMLIINEGNLYRAIFQSKKPEAEAFTDLGNRGNSSGAQKEWELYSQKQKPRRFVERPC